MGRVAACLPAWLGLGFAVAATPGLVYCDYDDCRLASRIARMNDGDVYVTMDLRGLDDNKSRFVCPSDRQLALRAK